MRLTYIIGILALSLGGCRRATPPEVATTGAQRRVDRQSPSPHVYTKDMGKVPIIMSVTEKIHEFVMKHGINPQPNKMAKEWKMPQVVADKIERAFAEESVHGLRFSTNPARINVLYGVPVVIDDTIYGEKIRLWYSDGTYKELEL
jgi:hypothetical protein